MVLLGFIGFDWVFTGFYWVLLGFSVNQGGFRCRPRQLSWSSATFFFFLTGAPGMELLPNVAGSQRDAVRNRCSIEKDQNTGTAQGKNTSKKSRVVERKKKKRTRSP